MEEMSTYFTLQFDYKKKRLDILVYLILSIALAVILRLTLNRILITFKANAIHAKIHAIVAFPASANKKAIVNII
nr:MAG TPA: hypothetical protein [Caudoviricetes sp.]